MARLMREREIISIHTPAWGVTRRRTGQHRRQGYFNPHSRVGSDGQDWSAERSRDDFNPHSRVGSDLNCNCWIIPRSEFQSTLPRGE